MMKTRASGRFENRSWNEVTIFEGEGVRKITRVSATNAFTGDIAGDGAVEYLIVYRDDESSDFIGYEQITGRIGDRTGTFVLEHKGTYEDGTVKSDLTVVPGTGTGNLSGLKGQGNFVWSGHEEKSTAYTLDYEFE